jgi:predicted amidohydrolase
VRIGFVQTKPVFGKKKENLDNAVAMIEEIDADLLVLPELFSTGYFFPTQKMVFRLSESVPDGRTVKLMKSLSRRKKCAFVFGMAERKSNRCYNSAICVKPDGKVHLYRKIHLYYKENIWFSPGNLIMKTVPFYEFKLGMMICYDWIYPEVSRVLALMGADLICHPSNLVMQYCQDAMITRSIENWINIITANRVGQDCVGDETLKFTGRSQITGVPGKILAKAGKTRPVLKTVDLDLSTAQQKNTNKINNLFKDCRPEFYAKLQDYENK